MKEIVYKFIKSQNKITQQVLFDTLFYRSIYGKLPEGLSDKYYDILTLVMEYERLDSVTQSNQKTTQDTSPAIQYKRGAPKGNRNNIWCQRNNNESTKGVQISTNESTKGVQISTNESTNSTNESTKTDTKEKKTEKEKCSPPQTLPLIKEKEKEKENADASISDTFTYINSSTQHVETPKASLHTENTKLISSVGTLAISSEELADAELFQAKFPFVEKRFCAAFIKWLTYKKERKQTYKSVTSLKVCYNQLMRLCDNNENECMKIVDTSIANNWSGLFELHKRGNSKSLQTIVMHNLSDPNRGSDTEYGW